MHILIISATSFEAKGIEAKWPAGRYGSSLVLEYLISGVGPAPAGIAVAERLCRPEKPDLLLNVGIAGALDPALELGSVVQVTHDSFGDLGVEDRDGSFISTMELGLTDGSAAPYVDTWLPSVSDFQMCRPVRGVTVATAHGNAESIAAFRKRTVAAVETMEGAAVSYAALRQNQPHLQLRALSNYVEPRNRESWELDLALVNLTSAVDHLLSSLPGALADRSSKLQLGL